MDTPTPHPQAAPAPDDRAQQLRGLLRVVNDLGAATDNLFKRIYGSLSRRHKTLVDTNALRRAQQHSRALQRRARTQSVELARLTGVLAVIDEGVVMQDLQGRIILMNESARNLLGGVKTFWDSPLGHMFADYAFDTPPISESGQIEPLGDPQRVTINNQWIGVRMARVFSDQGHLLGTIMVVSDLGPESLTDRLKTSFITHMTHELRTPLTSIKGMSDVLLNMPQGRPPDRRFLEAIGRNVAILDRMIVELLDLSEIETNSFEVRRDPIVISEQVTIVLSGLESRLTQAKLDVNVRVANVDRMNILGDARRLQWALGHLIENAIRYTLPGGKITIELGRIRDDNQLTIKVKDYGVGIADKDLPYIFERYYRGDARTPDGKVIDPRGLGQGLYIAKAVAEAHGGSLSVASILGEHTSFIMALPLNYE